MARLVKTMVLALMLGSVYQAKADCYIQVNICAPERGIGPGILFKDPDTSLITHNDPNRCLQRAREFLNYCGVPGDIPYAASFFYDQGAWKTAAVVTQKTSQIYVTDFANNWRPLQKDY
jgi:hypothetical protein